MGDDREEGKPVQWLSLNSMLVPELRRRTGAVLIGMAREGGEVFRRQKPKDLVINEC